MCYILLFFRWLSMCNISRGEYQFWGKFQAFMFGGYKMPNMNFPKMISGETSDRISFGVHPIH